jgi:UDP-galactopyranose mutase
VFQRPQHLMTRLAQHARVIFWEEPIENAELDAPRLGVNRCADSGVTVATPELPSGLDADETQSALKSLLDAYVGASDETRIHWYYTPMMLPFSEHLTARASSMTAWTSSPTSKALRRSC